MFGRFASRFGSTFARRAVTAGVVTSCAFFAFSDTTDCASMTAKEENSAFVFIKPGFTSEAIQDMVRNMLEAQHIDVYDEGDIEAKEIDEKRLIDTHYGAIASKAVTLKPSQLNVPQKGKDGFKAKFGLSWEDALSQGLVYNAMDAAAKLGVDGDGLEQLWRKINKDGSLIKFGGGFYCGKIDDMFVINGFYMSMRGAYTAPGKKIHYLTVRWDSRELSWEDFRGKVLGATNPNDAAPGSIRRTILENYHELGLPDVPNTGSNGVHASASPLEAMAERKNWLQGRFNTFEESGVDDFEALLYREGISRDTIARWADDAQVSYQGGKAGSVFDLVEDKNAPEVLGMVKDIN